MYNLQIRQRYWLLAVTTYRLLQFQKCFLQWRATKQKRLKRATALFRRFKFRDTKSTSFSLMKNFVSTHLLLHKTTDFGSLGGWEESQCQASAQNLLSTTWWFLLAFVLVANGGSILSTRKLKLTPRITLVIFLNSSIDCMQSASADCRFTFQQDGAPAHKAWTVQDWLQANCLDFIAKDQRPPVQIGLTKTPWTGGDVGGLFIYFLFIYWIYHKLHPKPKAITKLCRWSGKAFHRNQSTRLSKAFETIETRQITIWNKKKSPSVHTFKNTLKQYLIDTY